MAGRLTQKQGLMQGRMLYSFPGGNQVDGLPPACWLAGSGWLAEAEIGGVGMEQACRASGWELPTSKLTTREALHT